MKMCHVRKLMLLLAICLTLPSCKDGFLTDCVKSTGPVLREQRNPGIFNSVRLEQDVHLYISQDTAYRVEVEAGANLLPKVITEVRDSQLYITNENRCNWVRNLQNQVNVYIFCPDLQYISQLGSGCIFSADTLRFPRLLIEVFDGGGSIRIDVNNQNLQLKLHDGTTDICAGGRSSELYVYSSGYGPVDCLSLVSRMTTVHSVSTNDCYVQAHEELNASIFFIGNIYYKGDPPIIHANLNGQGKLLKL